MRFDANTGELISEDKVFQSSTFSKKTFWYFLKRQEDEGYAIVNFVNTDTGINLVNYNKKHEIVKEFPLVIKKGKYDYIKLVGCGMNQQGGIQISVSHTKLVEYPNKFDYNIIIFYLAPGLDQFITREIRMPDRLYPDLDLFTFNPFSNNLNFILMGTNMTETHYGRQFEVTFFPILLIAKDDMSSMTNVVLTHAKADEYLRSRTDSTFSFKAKVEAMNTDERGLTTIIANSVLKQRLGDHVSVTHYDDNGNELWATVIPMAHFNMDEYGPIIMGHESNLEVADYTALFTEKSTYLFFNDRNKYLDDMSLIPDSIYTYGNSNGIFYKVDRKRMEAKGYLFGEPLGDESKRAFISSVDCDERNHVFSSLIMHREGKKSSFKLAWCYLEP